MVITQDAIDKYGKLEPGEDSLNDSTVIIPGSQNDSDSPNKGMYNDKILDDDELNESKNGQNLNNSQVMNRSYHMNKSRDHGNKSQIFGGAEVSIDLGKLDEIERQNAEMKSEIERIENEKEGEIQK